MGGFLLVKSDLLWSMTVSGWRVAPAQDGTSANALLLRRLAPGVTTSRWRHPLLRRHLPVAGISLPGGTMRQECDRFVTPPYSIDA
jgi:hypothetical protein